MKQDLLKKYGLEVAVFLCGASLMILEITGSRILAPYVGTSTAVWSVLIGIILGFLSLGYYFGGKYADYKSEPKILANIILLSAVSVFLIILFNNPALSFIVGHIRILSISTAISALILFSVPSFLLGIVSPYAAKLKLRTLKKSGSTVGNLYAVSTIGSIIGTFTAGFFLIPFFGSMKTLYLIMVVLVISSVMVYPPKNLNRRIFIIIIFLLAAFFSLNRILNVNLNNNVVNTDTLYNRVIISKGVDDTTSRPVLFMQTDPVGYQAAVFTDDDNDLVFKYTKYFRLADFFNPDIQNTLALGGGGYSYPKDFLNKHPKSNIDVVEIDPGITALAKNYFNLKTGSRLTIYNEDARVFLNNNKKVYDAIYIDVFNSITIPFHLASVEVIRKIFSSLKDNGVVIVNIISSFTGEKSQFLRAEYATYKSVFPLVYLFQVNPVDSQYAQNIILVGLKDGKERELVSNDRELNSYLITNRQQAPKADLPILTDDHSPVDYYTLNLIAF